MTALEILTILQRDIHSTVFATVDQQGLPHTCVIDLMLCDDEGLYFLTAQGKAFYDRLTARPFVAVSGMRGKDTLSTLAISLRGAVRSIGRQRLDAIFRQNPYMEKIYPSPRSRGALEVFQIYKGEGEYFDLTCQPPFRQAFAFGGQAVHAAGYAIDGAACTGCSACRELCPAGCISGGTPRAIDNAHCLHCGNCYRVCPSKAVRKRGGSAPL